MKTFITLIITAFLILSSISVVSASGSSKTLSKFIPEKGDVVHFLNGSDEGFENTGKLFRFITNVNLHKKDDIRIIIYTRLKNPIIYNLSYDGTIIKLTIDKSYISSIPANKRKSVSYWSGFDVHSLNSGHEYYLYKNIDGKYKEMIIFKIYK